MPNNTRSKRNNATGSSVVGDVTSRVEKLEQNLQAELQGLKDQLLSDQDMPRTPTSISVCLEKIDSFEKKMLGAIAALKSEVRKVERKVADHRQEIMANSLVFNGLKEVESVSNYDEVCKIINQYFRINISKSDIDYCYRLGKVVDKTRVRPLVVNFVHRWLRDSLYNTKKCLKGSKIVLNECLTGEKLALYKTVREKVGVKKCWTWKGRVFVSVNDVKKQIHKISDLDE